MEYFRTALWPTILALGHWFLQGGIGYLATSEGRMWLCLKSLVIWDHLIRCNSNNLLWRRQRSEI